MRAGIEVAQIGDVPDRREGRLHIQGERHEECGRERPCAAAADYEAGEGRPGEQREHVLDPVEHRAGFRRVHAEQGLRHDRHPGVEAGPGSPGQHGRDGQDRQPHVVDAAVVVEPAIREDEDLDVVVDRAHEPGPVDRAARAKTVLLKLT